MRPQDAQDILRMIESLWQFDFGSEDREIWRSAIADMDAAVVTKAVMKIANESPYRPKVFEIRSMVRKLEADRKSSTITPALALSPGTRAGIPFWVRRWFVARFQTSPPDMRDFHEQYEGLVDAPGGGGWMPADEHEAQARKVSDAQVVAAVQ